MASNAKPIDESLRSSSPSTSSSSSPSTSSTSSYSRSRSSPRSPSPSSSLSWSSLRSDSSRSSSSPSCYSPWSGKSSDMTVKSEEERLDVMRRAHLEYLRSTAPMLKMPSEPDILYPRRTYSLSLFASGANFNYIALLSTAK